MRENTLDDHRNAVTVRMYPVRLIERGLQGNSFEEKRIKRHSMCFREIGKDPIETLCVGRSEISRCTHAGKQSWESALP